MLQVNLSGIQDFAPVETLDYYPTSLAHRALAEHTGEGKEFTGWLNLPERIIQTQLKQLLAGADKIRNQSEVLVVIGIGGSYLGARAGIEMIRSANYNQIKKDTPDIYFAGKSMSPIELAEIIELIGDRDFSVNVVSKSGGTLEPSLAFRFFKAMLEKKYGAQGAKKRIFVTTGSAGALRHIAESDGYDIFDLPDDVGGRYSALSAPGLLPQACAGIDIEKLLNAASSAMQQFSRQSPLNPVWQYATARQQLYRQGRSIEILSCFEPSFHYMGEWWKQLFGESEGKNGVGIFPASLLYSTDLHSLGQYLQDGPRSMIETFVEFRESREDLRIPFEIGDRDSLNYLAGKSLATVNKTVEKAVKSAHISGGVPVISISCDTMDETSYAELVCFFEMSCAISGYILGINPFDQPGVEAYKANMKQLLKGLD